jgi:hypothetical protein
VQDWQLGSSTVLSYHSVRAEDDSDLIRLQASFQTLAESHRFPDPKYVSESSLISLNQSLTVVSILDT